MVQIAAQGPQTAASPPPKPTLAQEFRLFLEKYNVVALAVAFIIGAALTALVQALVADIITPAIIQPLLPADADWRTASWHGILWGHFVFAVINFLVIALVVFLLVKFVLREDPTKK